MDEPTLGMLATATGLSGVVWLVMQAFRPALSEAVYDKWASSIAVIVGIVLSLVYAFARSATSSEDLLAAVLVGMFGGWMSQNVNTMVRRAAGR